MARRRPRPGEQHPEEYRRDLNPDAIDTPAATLQRARSAYDVKDAHRLLHDMDDDVLKGIPILPPGSRLEQSATYLDLADSHPRELTGENGTVGADQLIVPKASCDYNIWNRLIGIAKPERLGLA